MNENKPKYQPIRLHLSGLELLISPEIKVQTRLVENYQPRKINNE